MAVMEAELPYLRRCVELAAEALEAGDEPFGSVLVGAPGTCWPRTATAWPPATAPVTRSSSWRAGPPPTSPRGAGRRDGLHVRRALPDVCRRPRVGGLGRIVYVASSEQLGGWLAELGVPAPPVRTLAVREVAPAVAVDGPVPELTGEIHALHRRFHTGRA